MGIGNPRALQHRRMVDWHTNTTRGNELIAWNYFISARTRRNEIVPCNEFITTGRIGVPVYHTSMLERARIADAHLVWSRSSSCAAVAWRRTAFCALLFARTNVQPAWIVCG